METLNVGKLKKMSENVPDEYQIRSRSGNAHLDKDEFPWQHNFLDVVKKVKRVDNLKTIVLIRGIE